MLISFFLPKFSYSKDFDIVTLQRFSELNLESETILNKSIMKELRIETLVEMAKESDPELVNVDWVEAMEGHYCYYDDSKGEGKLFSLKVIKDFLWEIWDCPSFDIVVNLMKDELRNLSSIDFCYVDLDGRWNQWPNSFLLTFGEHVCKKIDEIEKKVNSRRKLSKLSNNLTALSSEKPTEEVHNEKDAEADSSIVNGFAALPEKFQNEPTKKLFDELIEKKWLNADFSAPKGLEGQKAYMFREIFKTLGIENYWQELSKFTGKNAETMRQGCANFEASKKFSDFNKIFQRFLRQYVKNLKNSELAPHKREK